jgi:hypothetical protein
MENGTVGSNQSKFQPSSSRLWCLVRWIPMTLMLLTLSLLLVLFVMGGMRKITSWYLLQVIPPVLGFIFLIAIGIYVLVKRRASKLLIITAVIALFSLSPAIMFIQPIAYPASLESTSPSATVRLPADVPLRVVWGGNSIKTNYHASAPDQRWAYDLLVEPYLTGSSNLEDYGCYGVPVVAPVSGRVVNARDGEPDEAPGITSNNVIAPAGNHVVIQLESGTYLVIAHLKEGSVLVKPGDTVEEGNVIGQCGNSGNTSEPHIHIHHQRQDPTLFPVNFAEGLPLYFRDHDGPPMPVGGIMVEGDVITATGDVVQHIGK